MCVCSRPVELTLNDTDIYLQIFSVVIVQALWQDHVSRLKLLRIEQTFHVLIVLKPPSWGWRWIDESSVILLLLNPYILCLNTRLKALLIKMTLFQMHRHSYV